MILLLPGHFQTPLSLDLLIFSGLLPTGRQLHRRPPDQVRDRGPGHRGGPPGRDRGDLPPSQDHQQVGLRGDRMRRTVAGKEEEVQCL